MEAIDTVYFNSIADFCDDVLDEYDVLPDLHRYMSILAPYSDVVEMLKEFILCDFKVAKIDVKSPEFEGEMEYYLDLLDGELWLYPAKDENGKYYDNDAYVGYIHGGANFRAIQAYCDTWSVREYSIEEQNDDYVALYACDEDERDICKDCTDKYEYEDSSYRKPVAENNVEIKDDTTDDGIKGFSATKSSDGKYQSYSFYSTDDDYVDDMREFVKKLFDM